MTHPTAVQVHAGEQSVANLVLVNGHSWQVQIGVADSFDGHEDIDEVDDRIMLGDGSDPEEAIEHAARELEEMASALRLHAKGLNQRRTTFEAKLAKLRGQKTKKAKEELERLVGRNQGKRVRYDADTNALVPFSVDSDVDFDDEDEA